MTPSGPLPISALGQLAAILTAVAAAHVLLHWWVRRRTRREASGGPWLAGIVLQLSGPLALLIWIHGLSIAAGIVLRDQAPASALVALRWMYGLSIVFALYWLLSRVGRLGETFLVSRSRGADTEWERIMLPLAGGAFRRTLPLLALIAGAPLLAFTPGLEPILRNLATLVVIGIVAFVLFQASDAAAAVILARYRLDVTDNLQARAVHTQVLVLRKIAVAVIAIFTAASMLMVFESARQFGASILASAGIAGLIIGFAAQRSIATLLAGFQIALTQPIRVDDVVIVEGEFGRIEDITLTYVVVRIWDLRRLVLPITYFIERPFQNWTRSSADLLASVFVHVDYTVPVEAVRSELTAILAASKWWDGKVNVLQVTSAEPYTVELRALASACDASQAWDLRCEVREKLIAFLQRHHPDSLPRFRATVENAAAAH